jgi:predicted nucleotidyltransferase
MTDNGLTDKQQNTLLGILRSNPHIEAVWLFGSRAQGNYRANSDIDIALAGGQLTTEDISALISQIEQTTIPYQVDILVTHRIKNQALLEHIEKYGQKWL